RRSREALPQIDAARASGDADRGVLFMGEDAGLIDSIEPAGALVERLASETEAILRERGALAVETEPGQRAQTREIGKARDAAKTDHVLARSRWHWGEHRGGAIRARLPFGSTDSVD